MTPPPIRALLARYGLVLRGLLLGLLLLGVLWPVLEYRSAQVGAQLHDLRERDPQAYLDTLRSDYGYSRFLDAYREIRGYDTWKARPPYLVEGGWRLYPEHQDVAADFTPATCHPALYLEPGQVHVRRTESLTREALYRIRDGQIQVQLADGTVTHLIPVAPGDSIYYLEVTGLPTLDGPRFAYHCG